MFGMDFFPEDEDDDDEVPRHFNCRFKGYSVAMVPGNEREDLERGGKIIMPPSALNLLSRLNVAYPMLFKLTNKKTKRSTHCGVLEFVADEGNVYLPYWMMKLNLSLDEGDFVQVESVSLPVATFSRFQPQSVDFLDIHDPKAVLENALRSFACLTTDDTIAIEYNKRVYELLVLETKPGPAVSIIECDMNVDFAPPLGYKEPEPPKEEPAAEEYIPPNAGFVAFQGKGNRLNGKKRDDSPPPKPKSIVPRVIPNYNYRVGTLHFFRNAPRLQNEDEDSVEPFIPFSGEGHTLSESKNKEK